MRAILEKGTKYAFSVSYDREPICLQSCLMLNKYASNDQWSCWMTQLGSESHLKKLVIAVIFGSHQIRLQGYMVPIVTDTAGIWWYAAYLVPTVSAIARIFGTLDREVVKLMLVGSSIAPSDHHSIENPLRQVFSIQKK